MRSRPSAASAARPGPAGGAPPTPTPHPAPPGEEPPAGGRDPRAVAEEEDQPEHRERVEQDARRVAARAVTPAPQAPPADAGQDLPVEEEGEDRQSRRLRPGEPAQERCEAPAANMQDPADELATAEAHAALTAAGTCPVSRSQRIVSRSPSRSGRER